MSEMSEHPPELVRTFVVEKKKNPWKGSKVNSRERNLCAASLCPARHFWVKRTGGRKGLESRMENGKEEVERSWKERVSGDEGEETGKAGRTCDAWREEEKERGRQEEREIKRGGGGEWERDRRLKEEKEKGEITRRVREREITRGV